MIQYRPESDTEYLGLPERYRDGMKRYIEDRIAPGHFLRAMLEGDLYKTLAHVDLDMVVHLREIYLWIYNEAPGTCWGSREAVAEWLQGKD